MAPTASLSKIITPSLLSYLRSHPTLPPHTWYYISAVTLSAINRPDEIITVFRDAIDRVAGEGKEEPMRVARRMREALVKGGAIGGLPKVSELIANSSH